MRYFKYIDIDNYQSIIEKSRKFVLEKYLSSQKSTFSILDWITYIKYCPEILTAFSKHGLIPYSGYIYSIFDKYSAPIHVDVINKKRPYKCRINIPIYNCEHSRTFYYRQINNPKVLEKFSPHFHNAGFTSYIKYEDDDPTLEKVDEVVVDRPTIMRVQEPHRVVIDQNYLPRVVLTFRMNIDPVYLLEEEEDDSS